MSADNFERLLRGEITSREYVDSLRSEVRATVRPKGWAKRWATTVVRAHEAEAESDRLRRTIELDTAELKILSDGLHYVAGHETGPCQDIGCVVAAAEGALARAAAFRKEGPSS